MFRQKSDRGRTTQIVGGLTLAGIVNSLYPVNALILTTDNVNPGTRFPGTTWVAYGAGRALVGVGNNGTNTYTGGQTFGSDGVTLTAGQSGVNSHTHASGGNTGGATARHQHLGVNPITLLATANASGSAENSASSITQGTPSGRFAHPVDPTGGSRQTTDDSPDHAHLTPASGAVAGPGTPTSHENRQTSIAVYVWQRTV